MNEKTKLIEQLWREGQSVAAIAKQLGMRPAYVRHKAYLLRKAGHNLKRRRHHFDMARIGGIFRSYGLKVRLE